MNLKEFVSETLVQLIEGVQDAQSRTSTTGQKASVNPRINANSEMAKHGIFIASGLVAQMVHFDVALTATEGTGAKGGIGVVGGMFTLGTTRQSQEESSSVSRVKFSVPVTLPESRV